VILDEAQNTTIRQMKMFLTRMGQSSKMIINGDVTQTDIETNKSGLMDACRLLKHVKGIGWSKMGPEDVVRHKLVRRIVQVYEERQYTE